MTPASAASLARVRPRRRRRGLGLVALLLCAAVVVALASHANESNASTSKPPAGKPRAPAAAAPRPTGDPTREAPSATQTERPDPPDANVVLVALGEVPAEADARDARAAARAAMRDWAAAGLDLREAEGEDADVEVRFVLDAADARPSERGVAVVPLGDRGCAGAWAGYDADTVRALAARALGQAMGRDGPAGSGELMDPDIPPRYAQECDGVRGTLDLSPGQSDGKAFRLGAAATVSYTMRVEGGHVDVCLLAPADWDAFMLGEGGGAACQYSTQSASDGARLEAGDHILGFRCVEASLPCHVEFTLAAQAAD